MKKWVLSLSVAAVLVGAAPRAVWSVPILLDWTWQMTTLGGPCTNAAPTVNPYVIYPDSWGTFEPWMMYSITDPPTCDWSQITFTQTAGPQANVFPTITVSFNEVNNNCQSVLHGDCAPMPVSSQNPPALGVYTITATVTGALSKQETVLATAEITVANSSVVPAASSIGLVVLVGLMLMVAGILLYRRRARQYA